MSSLLNTALHYHSLGLSMFTCINKKPILDEWGPYMKQQPTEDEVRNMFANARPNIQIALVCGKASGNLEVIDVDVAKVKDKSHADLFWNDLLEYFNNSLPLVVVRSPSGGYHIYYRCEEIEGNKKLANTREDGQIKGRIETRGQGGYVIAPPSKGYEFINPGGISIGIKTISPEVRRDLLDLACKYNDIITEEKKKPSNISASNFKSTPWDDYNSDQSDPWRKVLQDKGWEITGENNEREYWKRPGSDNRYGATWNKDLRLFYVFTSSSEFEPSKAVTPFAIYAIMNCNSDFSKATNEVRALGYGEMFSKEEEGFIFQAMELSEKGLSNFDILNMLHAEFTDDFGEEYQDDSKVEREKKISNDLNILIKAGESRAAIKKGIFWTVNKNGNVRIDKNALSKFLTDHSFRLYVDEPLSPMYRIVKIDYEHHIIYEYHGHAIRYFIKEWILNQAEDIDVPTGKLLNALIDTKDIKDIMEFLDRLCIKDINLLRDTRDTVWLPFRNMVVKVTKEGVDEVKYSELPKDVLIWDSQIKDKDIELLDVDVDDFNRSPIYRFVKRLSGITPDIEAIPFRQLHKTHPEQHKRLFAFMTHLGYLMSNYKDPGRPYLIMLAEDTPDDGLGGGTGKGFCFTIIQNIRSVKKIAAKTWKPDGQFAWQTVALGDDVVVLEDIPNKFDMEMIYNTITEGMVLEKKHKDALTIPYKYSPKIGITTNYLPDLTKDHAARRVKMLLVHKYFTKNYTPADDGLGTMFDDDWPNMEWQLYFNMCTMFIQAYLQYGFTEFSMTENAREKSIKLKYQEEFFLFMQSFVQSEMGKWKSKTDLRQEFLTDSEMDPKYFSAKRFNDAIKFYADTYGLVVSERKNNFRASAQKNQKFFILTKIGEDVPDLKINEPVMN